MLALLFGFVDVLLGLAGVFTLLLKSNVRKALINILVAFAAGSLLGGAFFHLLPEASERLNPFLASEILVFGFLLFLLLEEYLHWHHCREEETRRCKTEQSFSWLMVIGDFIHNIIDGFVIMGGFVTGLKIGLITAFMILLHELPQELGIFAVLVHGGFKEKRALKYSVIAQSSVLLGIIIAFFSISKIHELAIYLLPFAAGGFLYITASDLIPELQEATSKKRITSLVWLFIGLLFMLGIKLFFEG